SQKTSKLQLAGLRQIRRCSSANGPDRWQVIALVKFRHLWRMCREPVLFKEAMKGNELFKVVSHEFLPFMEEHGYFLRRGDRRFVKFEGTLEKRITLTVPQWTGGAGHHVDHLCEYRLPLHESLYNNYQPYRTDKVKEFVPT